MVNEDAPLNIFHMPLNKESGEPYSDAEIDEGINHWRSDKGIRGGIHRIITDGHLTVVPASEYAIKKAEELLGISEIPWAIPDTDAPEPPSSAGGKGSGYAPRF